MTARRYLTAFHVAPYLALAAVAFGTGHWIVAAYFAGAAAFARWLGVGLSGEE